ncbi:MAG: UDP-2,3-diacylglucosamine diphosphatase [Candidatus Eisenbacteria bacterium]|nr:UDP-2,3-diacylglucosamine diphosphatase [Candidatus Eisenbacteria bacterium]
MVDGCAYFFSDAHLGQRDASGEARKRHYLQQFLAHVRTRPGPVYVVGDLFDFWFEYRHAVPRGHFEVLSALIETRRAGAAITYVGGNHDFWLGDFLAREVGMEVALEPIAREIQGRKLYVAHGDGMMPGDRGYHALRAILRNPFNIGLYRWLHPDLGIPLAKAVSSLSYRNHHHHPPPTGEAIYREVATPRLAAGHDAVILGHFHLPYHHREPGREMVVLGDWMTHFTYATLEGGVFRMWRWTEDGPQCLQGGPEGPPGGVSAPGR